MDRSAEVSTAQAVAAAGTAGVAANRLVAVAARAGVGVALAGDGVDLAWDETDGQALATLLAAIDVEVGPRWAVWSARELADLGAASRCWDIAAVHRLIVGGWRARPGIVWAHHRGLDPAGVPAHDDGDGATVDLFTAAERATGDPDDPVRADGYLRPEWGRPDWSPTLTQLRSWATVAFEVASAQVADRDALSGRHARVPQAPPDPAGAPALASPVAALVARSESAASLLCTQLTRTGLPMDRGIAESIITDVVGPRPTSASDAESQRRTRDHEVLTHVPGAEGMDLRNPGQVRSLLRRAGIEVEDTRAWRLRGLVGTHPVVEPLLAWRKAERIATTFGYQWLDEHLHDDGRLRGSWSPSDGAAGRMTATAGLHNMTAELRPAVVAESGWTFVRSDLGQIEPRVLAAVSGDRRLAAASRADDLYADVAADLGVEREIAKVAVLGAMYGQTTGRGAQALAQLRSGYPVAMALLEHADLQARSGRDVRTHGGRLLVMDSRGDLALAEAAARSRAAARGRYGRNAVIQGAAAELFKLWAVTVRARIAPLGAEIVLCLHDELLVHAPVEVAADVAADVDGALQDAVGWWDPSRSVRFLTDTSIVARWSDAKG